MIIVGVADIHGDGAALEKVLNCEPAIDAVFLLGDITNFGGQADAEAIIEIARRHADTVLGVDGNCDPPEVGNFLERGGVNLRGRALAMEGISWTGIGGSLPCPGRTPNETDEEGFASMCELALSRTQPGMPFAIAAHQPPLDTACDRSFLGHVGSSALRRFIEKHRPVVFLCGHIHEGAGIDRVEGCIVANPGPVRRGGYIRLDVESGVVRAIELKHCR